VPYRTDAGFSRRRRVPISPLGDAVVVPCQGTGLMDISPSDAELWTRGARGETEAFGTLFDRHHRAVYNFAFRSCGNWATAEDLVSVVFLEAWRRRGDVAFVHDSALPWLLGVATNLLRNHRRALKRYGAAIERCPRPIATPDFADDVADRIDDELRMRAVRRALRRLRPAERDVLACGWSGLTYEETSHALGIPVGTVRSRLSRARARLAKLAGETEPDPRCGHDKGEHRAVLRTAKGS
jgi:RNA polymerase sigma factor (sigma-70 family)